jgi:ketosteroid isomerase-like protein
MQLNDPLACREVVEAATLRSQALVAGDVSAMAEILAPEFVYVNASGQVFTRDAYLHAYVGSEFIKWQSQNLDEVQVLCYGDVAVLICRVRDQTIASDQWSDDYYRSQFVYVKRDSRWQCVTGQTTHIPRA